MDNAIAVMVSIALALWSTLGPFLHPVVTIESADENPAYNEARPSDAWTGGNGTAHCTITVWHKYFDTNEPSIQQLIIDHEVGHCIGLMHRNDSIAIMNEAVSAGGTFTLTDADKAEFYRVHPLPGRLHIAMVAIQ